MSERGDVYYGRLTFNDGGSSLKFLIVVYSDKTTNRVLCCTATKEIEEKNKMPGCHPGTQRFFIKNGEEGFVCDTFIEMLRFREWSYSDFLKNVEAGLISFDRKLSSVTINMIKECYKKLKYDVPTDKYSLLIT